MHEFEGLLFSEPRAFAEVIGRPELAREFVQIRNEFETPEHINDSPITAPSKLILNLVSGYRKPLMGENAARHVGIHIIRQQCPLFDAWLRQLESLPPLD